MKDPEAILEIKRNWRGKIIKIEYKVIKEDKEGEKRLQFLELVQSIFSNREET